MRAIHFLRLALLLVVAAPVAAAQQGAVVPGSTSLTATGDFSAQMVQGIDRWLTRETQQAATNRTSLWKIPLEEGFRDSMRQRLREVIGAVDARIAQPRLEFFGEGRSLELFRAE